MNAKPLYEQFREYVNPGKIPDGHCASCAFNTYLLLMGYINEEQAEAFEPGGDSFKKFGDWFYEKFMTNKDNNVILSLSISSKKNQTIRDFEELVKNEILDNTKPGEAVIICVDYGTHWYNAYHTPSNDVVFIDAQSGIQFNVYSSILKEDTNIDIIIPKEETVKEYLKDVLPKIKSGGKHIKKYKKRKTNKKKHMKKKTRKNSFKFYK